MKRKGDYGLSLRDLIIRMVQEDKEITVFVTRQRRNERREGT